MSHPENAVRVEGNGPEFDKAIGSFLPAITPNLAIPALRIGCTSTILTRLEAHGHVRCYNHGSGDLEET